MKEEKIQISFTKVKIQELGIEEQNLISKARNASGNAYAPYSGFLVGASVMLENGEIINGSNQENAAYPSGLCAERVALFYVGAKYPGVAIKAIAISAKSKTFEMDDVVSPCGACRQVMAEYQQKQEKNIRVLLHSSKDDVLIAESISDLLPLMFNPEKLRKF
jgi:cytidine deaminase